MKYVISSTARHTNLQQAEPSLMNGNNEEYGAGCGEIPGTPATTTVGVTALDGIVNVNGLFTTAVFIGLSFTPPEPTPISAKCTATSNDIRQLFLYEVISFSCFLFSSLIAQGLKITISIVNSYDETDHKKAHINSRVLQYGIIGSAFGSVVGGLFLMLSMVYVVEVKLGKLTCGGKSVAAAAIMIVFGSSSVVFYISSVLVAFMKKPPKVGCSWCFLW